MNKKPRIVLLGVPMDLGGGRRGVDMGPSAVRIARLQAGVEELGYTFVDSGNVSVREPEALTEIDPKARFLAEISDCCAELRSRVETICAAGDMPLVIGGDHSIAAGTVAGISSHAHSQGERIGLIWFDAHADMNTPETTESGNIHGMPLASILGRGAPEMTGLGSRTPMVDPECVALVGVRCVDEREREVIRETGIRVFTMREIDMIGIHRVMEEAIAIANNGTSGFHLSFDIDGTDPSVAPGVGTPVRGGTTLRESHLIMELVAETGSLIGLEMTEINPILDDRNLTARFGVELLLSALGKSTL